MSKTPLLRKDAPYELGEEFGPAMLKLSIEERLFVCLMFHGAVSATDAVEKAGFVHASRGAMRVKAYHLLHSPRIGEAMVEESRRRNKFLLPKAQSALHDIISDAQHPQRIKAIQLAMGVAGVVAAQEINVTHKVMTESEKVARITELAVRLGHDPALLLGGVKALPAPVDAEFEEVSSNPSKAPEGLEEIW